MGEVIRFPIHKVKIEKIYPDELAVDELADLLADLNSDIDISWEELMYVCLFGMAKCAVNSGHSRESFMRFLKGIRIEEFNVSK